MTWDRHVRLESLASGLISGDTCGLLLGNGTGLDDADK